MIDTRARLAWPRCVEGMRWSGNGCTGVPQLLSYGQAQALARQRWQAEGVRWRLPRVNELRRLVNRQALPPSVDTQLFPAMPATGCGRARPASTPTPSTLRLRQRGVTRRRGREQHDSAAKLGRGHGQRRGARRRRQGHAAACAAGAAGTLSLFTT